MQRPVELSAESLWTEVSNRLRDALNESTFTTWFTDTEPIELSGERFVLAVPNDFTRTWIEDHFLDLIQAAIRETKEETGFDVALDGLLATWMRPGFPILVVIYRAHITGGALQVAPDEASEAKFFLKEDLPPLEEIAWPSAAYGLDAWRAYEPPRP